jgi:hypothetical protein
MAVCWRGGDPEQATGQGRQRIEIPRVLLSLKGYLCHGARDVGRGQRVGKRKGCADRAKKSRGGGRVGGAVGRLEVEKGRGMASTWCSE